MGKVVEDLEGEEETGGGDKVCPVKDGAVEDLHMGGVTG